MLRNIQSVRDLLQARNRVKRAEKNLNSLEVDCGIGEAELDIESSCSLPAIDVEIQDMYLEI